MRRDFDAEEAATVGMFDWFTGESFSTSELKPVLQDVVTRCGWTWRGITFGKR